MDRFDDDRAVRLRLASQEPSVRAGAQWELLLAGCLEDAGAAVSLHPYVAGLQSRPDIGAASQTGTVYVEATATGGGSLTGHRQATPAERLHDVLMSRLKHKSRALQGISAPLVVAVLCISPRITADVVAGALDEFVSPSNVAGRNVSAVVAAWDVDATFAPRELTLRRHPRAVHHAPDWAIAALSALRDRSS